jgi:hypothetical protein
MVAASAPRSFRILEWKLLSLVPEDDDATRTRRKRHPISRMIQSLARLLRPILRSNPTANIFVEQQSTRARDDMQKLAYGTLGVCVGVCGDGQSASFISASSKSSMIQPHLPDLLPTGKPTYAQRKRAGIEACRALLVENEPCEKWLEFFDAAPKKDDLADSLLLAVAALSRDVKADRVVAIDVGSTNFGLMVMEATA